MTLFHALPGMVEGELCDLLASLAGEFRPPQAQLSAIMPLGGGTAFRIDSAEMLALRALVAQRFAGMLTPQDSHVPRLHVTVQNKVTGAQAKALQAVLAARFEPRSFAFAGLALHAYRGGPWEALGAWTFRGRHPAG